MNKTLKVGLLVLVALLLTGCGRKWEQLWGQDTKPEKVWMPMRPSAIEAEIRNDKFFIRDSRIATATYISVWACDQVDVCLPLPQATEEPLTGQATCLVDRSHTDEWYTMPGLISFFNLKTKLPWASKVRVDFVEY